MAYENIDILLRELRSSDSEDLYLNVKDKEIARWTTSIPHPYPRDGAKRFINMTKRQRKLKKLYSFGIILIETDKLIGVIILMKVDEMNRNSEVGYWLGKSYWNRGYMTSAIKLITKFGFKELMLRRIYGKPFKENIGSRRALEKAGFILEGEMKDEIFRYGKWHSTLTYAAISRR